MRGKHLARHFFNKNTLIVAKELLGKFLVRKIGHKTISAMITETEAYCGPNDLASHASKGKTKRNEAMFGPPGHAYVYLIYGMHHCFNIVTEKENYPAAVLIRCCELINPKLQKTNHKKLQNSKSLETSLNGPGKLCRYFKIDKTLNKEDLIVSKKLWLEDRGIKIKPSQIKRQPRVGVDYAGSYKNKLWRFALD